VLKTLSFESRDLAVGSPWVLRVLDVDDDGTPGGTAPTIVVTLPGGTVVDPAPVAESRPCPGVFRAIYVPTVPGRHLAAVTSGVYVAHFVAYVSAITSTSDMPDVVECDDYIGENSYTDEEIQTALDTEATAQRRRCRVPAVYPDDLRGALLRRVMRNLALKGMALAVKESADGDSQIVIPGNDPEVKRLEAPHRKVTVG
jgi:hypothetical protein